jgi:hypothetical protein
MQVFFIAHVHNHVRPATRDTTLHGNEKEQYLLFVFPIDFDQFATKPNGNGLA